MPLLLAELMVMGVAAICVGELVERADALGERFAARVRVGMDWLLAWGAVALAGHAVRRRSPRRGRRPSIGRIVGGTLSAAATVMWFVIWSLTFSRTGSDPIESIAPEDAVPRLTFLLGSLVAFGGYLVVRFLRDPRLRARARRFAEGAAPSPIAPFEDHDAVVLDVRPREGDGFEPYFVGTCSCGWVGPVREDVRLAVADVTGHRPGGEPEIIRPLA